MPSRPGLQKIPYQTAPRRSHSFWERVEAIDDGELWETHQTLKTQLIEIARRRAAHQAERRGEPPEVIAQLR